MRGGFVHFLFGCSWVTEVGNVSYGRDELGADLERRRSGCGIPWHICLAWLRFDVCVMDKNWGRM